MLSTPVQPSEWLQALQVRGFRVTPTKESLLVLLTRAAFPLSAEKAWEFVRGERPHTGRATVYRLFDALEEFGFLRRVHGLNHCNQYVLAQDSERPFSSAYHVGKQSFSRAMRSSFSLKHSPNSADTSFTPPISN